VVTSTPQVKQARWLRVHRQAAGPPLNRSRATSLAHLPRGATLSVKQALRSCAVGTLASPRVGAAGSTGAAPQGVACASAQLFNARCRACQRQEWPHSAAAAHLQASGVCCMCQESRGVLRL
jgi:hypothetical protein